MCATCGCGDESGGRVTVVGADEHEHLGGHDHEHGPNASADRAGGSRTVLVETAVLAKNDESAQRNRAWLTAHHVVAVNLMSSPGSGKTTLLERTIRDLGTELTVGVVEGDQETLLDAERIRATGARAVQINTGAGCHLDAVLLDRGLRALAPPDGSLVFVENVGNLVCPALFDLGEAAKVVVISVTEGDDKPLKYPQMFAVADLVVVNKTDLLPYVDFDVEACSAAARAVNPAVAVLPLSARTGQGLDAWYHWLHGPWTAGPGGNDRS